MILRLLHNKAVILSALIVYTALVCYLSLTRIQGPVSIHIWDKAAHACVYFGFAILSGLLASNRKQYLWLLAGWFCFGILIEILQGYTSYRSSSALDQLANTVGLTTGFLIINRFKIAIQKNHV